MISSNLNNNLNSDITFPITTENIGSITTSNGQRYVVPNSQTSPLGLTELITNNNTILTLNFDSSSIDTCNNFFDAGNSFIAFVIIIIVISIAGFVIFLLTGSGEIDLTTIFIAVLISSLALIFGMIIINNIGKC